MKEVSFLVLDPKYREMLINLKQEDITRDFIEDNLVNHYDPATRKVVKPKFNWSDEFSLKKGQCHNSTDIAKTNVGLFIYNKFIIENLLEKVIGYWNEPITAKVLKKIESKIHEALEKDIITTDDYAEYQNRLQWILAIHAMTCGSFTKASISPNKELLTKRDKLLKENKDKLEAGDAITAIKIEKELVKTAQEKLKDDPSIELFDSGARGDFDNNYKNINIMRGPIMDPITGKYKIATRSFSEGIRKEDIPIMGSTIIAGAYPKAVDTKVGGYAVKRFYAEFQGIVLGPKGSDCGSKRTIEVLVEDYNKNDCLYRYIIEGKHLVKITPENINKYMGKKVNMRTPMFCTSEHHCNVCFGDKPYMIGVKNIGLTAAKIGSNFVNLGMKSFHKATMSLNEINPKNILL